MRVLLLSPHIDDVELGAGGTVVKLLEQKNAIKWIVFSTCEDAVPIGMPKDTLKKEFLEVVKDLGIKNYEILNFKNKHFPEYRQEILDKLFEIKNKFRPDLVICPSLFDFHQDHKTIAEECFRCFKRDSSILGYEMPWNYTNFPTTYFSRLNEEHIEKKLELLKHYKSQFKLARTYFSEDFIRGIARVRGIQCNSYYAEAFEVIRWIE